MTSPNKNWTNWTWSLSFVVKKSCLKVKRGKQMVGRSPNHQKKKWKMENKVKKIGKKTSNIWNTPSGVVQKRVMALYRQDQNCYGQFTHL
jgi:hypothetical protein